MTAYALVIKTPPVIQFTMGGVNVQFIGQKLPTYIMRAWDTVNNQYVYWMTQYPNAGVPPVTVPLNSGIGNLTEIAIVNNLK